MVDRARTAHRRKAVVRRASYACAVLVCGLLAVASVSRLEPALPVVRREALYVDKVQRGPLVRQVRGTGKLVPDTIRWISATTEGIVDRIELRPGAVVTPDTIVAVLRNPALAQVVAETELKLKGAEARHRVRAGDLDVKILEQKVLLATMETELVQAGLQVEAERALEELGLVSMLEFRQSMARERGLKNLSQN